MPSTFSLPRVRLYPGGPPICSWDEMRSFVLCVYRGLFPTRLIFCDSPCLPYPPPPHCLSFPSHHMRGDFFHSLKMHLVSLGLSRGGIKVEAEPSECGEPSGLGTEPPALPGQAGQRALLMKKGDFPSVLPALCCFPQCRS